MASGRRGPHREGGCLCGELRCRITAEPLGVVVCHCPDCQGQSGSAFGMSMFVPRDAFEWLSGERRTWSTHAASRLRLLRQLRNRILNRLGALPETVNVKPGTLDDRSWLEPAMQVWTETKPSWVSILDGKPSFPRNPGSR